MDKELIEMLKKKVKDVEAYMRYRLAHSAYGNSSPLMSSSEYSAYIETDEYKEQAEKARLMALENKDYCCECGRDY